MCSLAMDKLSDITVLLRDLGFVSFRMNCAVLQCHRYESTGHSLPTSLTCLSQPCVWIDSQVVFGLVRYGGRFTEPQLKRSYQRCRRNSPPLPHSGRIFVCLCWVNTKHNQLRFQGRKSTVAMPFLCLGHERVWVKNTMVHAMVCKVGCNCLGCNALVHLKHVIVESIQMKTPTGCSLITKRMLYHQ